MTDNSTPASSAHLVPSPILPSVTQIAGFMSQRSVKQDVEGDFADLCVIKCPFHVTKVESRNSVGANNFAIFAPCPTHSTPPSAATACPVYAGRIPSRRFWFGRGCMHVGSGSVCRIGDCRGGRTSCCRSMGS